MLMHKVIPGQKVPDFQVETANGSVWRLYENAPKNMLMVDFYRGYHCPRCRTHIETINSTIDDFTAAGMDVLVASTDSAERANLSRDEWDCDRILLGHGLSLEDASRLGLYLSSTIDIRPMEQKIFCEPAVMLIRSDLTLYGAIIQSFPFARPDVSELLSIPTFAEKNNYPPRGDYVLQTETEASV